jgi:predicted phage terminase large subunit-like protein
MSSVAFEQTRELYELLDRQVKARARISMLDFAVYTRPHYQPNWHHRLLCELLDQFAQRVIKRLMVFMPPRHGKSELVSRCLPAYLLGRDPDCSIIATSYSSSLASRMNRDVQRIMDTEAYQEVFPGTSLNSKNVVTVAQGTWLRNASTFEVVGRRGSYRSAGVGGGIMGMGADFGIIDDPIKNQDDAYSTVWRDKVWDWYISTLYTRLEGERACILVTLTRWHDDDLAGRLLKQMAEDPASDQWHVISLPAVCEPNGDPRDPRDVGEALWPDKFPLEILEKNKANGSYFWNALFQQRPAPPEGSIVQRSWVRRYRHLPEGCDNWLQSWDLTFKETRKGSYVCGQIWCRKGADFYLVDQHRERMDFPKTLATIRKMADRYPQCTAVLVEDKANGPAVISSLKAEISGLIAVQVEGSKEARLHSVSPLIEAGNVLIPDERWADDLVDELISFPNSAFNDQVDTLSQALSRYKRRPDYSKLQLNLDVGAQTNPWSM